MGHRNKRTRKQQRAGVVRQLVNTYNSVAIQGFTDNEIKEVDEYMEFFSKFMTSEWGDSDLVDYAISQETHAICFGFYHYFSSKNWRPETPEETINIWKNLLIEEARHKEFDSILTYVRFLKLTLLEEDGVYRIVSEQEQSHIKVWVHMENNFSKWGIDVEIASQESNNVWNVPHS